MKKSPLLLALTLLFSATAQAQDAEQTISKDEFVKSQLAMMEQMKQVQKDMAEDAESMMRDKMTPEEFAQYKAEADAEQKEQEEKVADCLGIPAEQISSMSEKVGPDFQIDVIKSCSSKLPETLSLDNMDWDSNADFAAYKECAENMVAKEIGVSSAKLQQCSTMAANM